MTRSALLGDPRDVGDGLSHRFVPAPGHQVSPPAAHGPEIGSQLTLIVKMGGVAVLGELESLDDVRNGAAQEPEVDGARALEPDVPTVVATSSSRTGVRWAASTISFERSRTWIFSASEEGGDAR